jgi:hypothetical protein
MQSALRNLGSAFLCLSSFCVAYTQKTDNPKVTNEMIEGAQTVAYCEVEQHPETFKDTMVRVRGLYETDFEKSIITAPPCNLPVFMTWVDFDKQWESRSKRQVRRALAKLKWGVQADVVFIGRFRSDGHYGHMDMYMSSIEVYKVEAVHASGSFQPLPEQGTARH